MLVAFTSMFGSTRGIAERIVARLEGGGHRAELRACGEVADLGQYDAVVLGSAVFNRRWLPGADEFVRRNLEALRARPVWLFSVGAFGDHKPIIGPLIKREPRNIRALEEAIHPRDYRVFAGIIDRHQWPSFRLLYHVLGGRLGDSRDWPAIDAWADGIGHSLFRVKQ